MVGTLLSLALALAPTAPQDRPDAQAPPRFEPPPEPFVPLHPRTAEQRQALEALKLFASARALEDQRKIPEAIDLLERALEKDPESVPILDRLSRLQRALGRLDESIATSRKALELDPGDSTALLVLVGYELEAKKDPRAAEALIRRVLDDPKLPPDSAGALLARRVLGDVDAEFLDKMGEAADAFARVVEALDRLRTSELTPTEYRRILRGDEAQSYLRFGEVFLRAGRFDDAVKALRRGLVFDPESAVIPRFLAEAQLKAGEPADALATLDDYLRRQPQGREPYELLGRVLDALGRDEEFLPRLEAAAKADAQNIALQFALAEQYRKAGREGEAEALLRDLLARQGDPSIFGPLAASLLNEKKTEELARVLRDAMDQREGPQAVAPQVQALIADPEYAAQVLDAAIALYRAEPAKFTRGARELFGLLATRSEHPDRLVALDRLAVEHDPSAQNALALAIDLFRNSQYAEAADAARELIDRYPERKSAETLDLLARSLYFAGDIDAALKAARDAQALDPNAQPTLFFIGYLLSRLGRHDEAIAHYNAILERFPNDDDVELQARAGLSAVYVDMEDFQKGEAELERLLLKHPDDPGVNNDLGYLYADQGKKLEQAESMIRKAMEAEPENSAYLDSLGWVLFKRGKPEEALEPLKKAAAQRTADTTVLDHIGDVYYGLKRYRDARESWKRAAEVATKSEPPDDRLPDIRKKLDELDQLLSASPEAGDPGDAPPPP
jgi:tetratricopeptide (TPR) repeat protein